MVPMPVPEFLRDLRAHIGHRPLWLSGVSAVVLDDRSSILLTRRRDSDEWAVPSGILEPGEEPGPAVRREIGEETGVEVELVRITSVDVTPTITYPNGDQASYLDVCFLARHVDGTAHVADDENSAVGWFAAADLPTPLSGNTRRRIAHALDGSERAWFAG